MGDDRAMMRGENRNQGYGSDDERLQDRQHADRGTGTDDRWAGRGGQGYWEDRGERGYQPPRNTAQGGFGGRSDEGPRGGYQSGYNQQGFHPEQQERATSHGTNRGSEPAFKSGGSMGTQGTQGSGGNQGANQSHYGHVSQGLGQAGYGRGDQGSIDYRRTGQGEHRGKGPKGFQRSDEKIREMVCEALTDDDHVDASSIEVTVTGAEVTLSGSVPDRQTKRMAEDTAERVAGVKDVHNQLRIGASSSAGSAGNGSEISSSDRKHRA
jgi:osmotically-inducible protein OsmY